MAKTKNASAFSTKPSILSAVGLILVVLAILILIYHPYEHFRKKKLRFNTNDDCFNAWSSPASDIYMGIYIFNVTNKDAFLEGREKLRVQEVGPYTWKQHMKRKNPVFHPENQTVTVNPTIEFEWMPSMSVGKEDDVLMLPNVAYLLFQSETEQSSYFKKMAVRTLIKLNSQPIVPQTVKEFLFGYESEVIKLGKTWTPDRITYDKLGLVDRTYDLRGDVVNAYADHVRAGTFAAYNNQTTLKHWRAPCNQIDGSSDAVKFPAEIQPNQSLSFYTKSMCRAIPMVQAGNEETIKGLRSIRYKFREDALDYSGDNNDTNKCFCRDDTCLKDGLIDITDCSNGFSVALSYPHFYNGDPSLVEKVDGLKPGPEHETYFDINPETGTLFRCSVKIQTNAVIGDVRGLEDCKAFSDTVVPLIWMNVFVDGMKPYDVFKFIIFLRVMPWLDRVGPYILLILGLSFIVYGGHCFRRIKMDRKKSTGSEKNRQYSIVATEDGQIPFNYES